jgi:hypothetical protein
MKDNGDYRAFVPRRVVRRIGLRSLESEGSFELRHERKRSEGRISDPAKKVSPVVSKRAGKRELLTGLWRTD